MELVDAPQIEEIQKACTQSLEGFLTEFLSHIFQKNLIAVASSKTASICESSNLFCFKCSSGGRIALNFEKLSLGIAAPNYFLKLLQLAPFISAYNKNMQQDSKIFLSDRFKDLEQPRFEAGEYKIYQRLDHELVDLGLVQLFSTSDLVLNESYEAPLESLLYQSQAKISLCARISRSSFESEQLLEIGSFYLESRGLFPPGRFYGNIKISEELMSFDVLDEQAIVSEEIPSEEEGECKQLDIALELGQLTLKIEDLLTLRPGAKISFERPLPFKAVLKVADSQWAHVDVEFAQTGVELTVEKIVKLNP